MKLRNYEIEVLKVMLDDRITIDQWNRFVLNYTIDDYDYTGVGYFLKIIHHQSFFEQETISKPVVTGKFEGCFVGFILYIEQGYICIECHNWGGKELSENVRDLDFRIDVE